MSDLTQRLTDVIQERCELEYRRGVQAGRRQVLAEQRQRLAPTSPVTAVGRLLKPLHGEPQVRRLIRIRPDGTIRRINTET